MQFDEELKDMQAKLQAAMEDAEMLPRHKMWQLRSCLSGWPANGGLGVDLWVLKLWANLPDASLRMLLLILSLMEEGNMPMQTLMVLIGLLPKPKGGETDSTDSHALQARHQNAAANYRRLADEGTWLLGLGH